jgi:hypothetical protein
MTSAQASRAMRSFPTLNVIQLPSPTTGKASPLEGIARVRTGPGLVVPAKGRHAMPAPMAANERRAARRLTGNGRDIENAPGVFRAPVFDGDELHTRRLSCATIVQPNDSRVKVLIEDS